MQVKRYQWSENFRGKADPNAVGRAIDRLGSRLGRDMEGIEPSELVEEAKHPESPLHRLFTWDDAKAAAAHREEEARYVLRNIRVVKVDERREEHVFIARVAVKTDPDSNVRQYVPMSIAARNRALQDQMIADAIAGLKGWRNRYEHLQGAKAALDHIDRALAVLRNAKPTKIRQAVASV